MEFIASEIVLELLGSYPARASEKLKQLRNLILETAQKTEGIHKLLETTKWGEPSYVTKTGSTIRIDWKEKTPTKYYIYFICTTDLVSTFKVILGDELQFEGNRAIVLDLDEDIPSIALQQCISLALVYHKVKHLPLLGV